MALGDTRILHVITRSDWGGAARVVKLLSERSAAETAVACGPGGRLIDELVASDVPVYVQPHLKSPPDPVGDFRAFRQLRELLDRTEFDVVHCHSTKAGLLGRLSATLTGIPRVFTVHGWGFYNTEYDWLSTLIALGERGLTNITDEIVCVSNNDFRRGIERKIISPETASVVHNGIPPISIPDERSRLSAVLGIDSEVPIIGAIARLEPQKNPLGLLDVARRLRNRGSSVAVVLIGDGPLMDECEAFVERHGLENVSLLGFRADALELLPDFDVFLMPSKFEGLPIAVLEAMQARVPVVSFDVGGVSELVHHGRTGYIVKPGEVEEFTRRVERLVDDAETRVEMGATAERIAREKFSASRMVSEYDEIYESVLSEAEAYGYASPDSP